MRYVINLLLGALLLGVTPVLAAETPVPTQTQAATTHAPSKPKTTTTKTSTKAVKTTKTSKESKTHRTTKSKKSSKKPSGDAPQAEPTNVALPASSTTH